MSEMCAFATRQLFSIGFFDPQFLRFVLSSDGFTPSSRAKETRNTDTRDGKLC